MKRFNLTLIVVLFLFFFFGSDAFAQYTINLPIIRNQLTDVDALIAFYHSTGGENWTNNSGWLDETISHCQWFGVTCDDETSRVTRINLENNNLSGSIPPEFGNLTSLIGLFLDDNQLSTLPETIGNLTNLQGLYLTNNQLSTLPESFGNLASLQAVFMDFNQLTMLPESCGNLTNLEGIRLVDNQLSTLPESCVNLTNLIGINLIDNPISCLPTQALVDWYNSAPSNPDSFPLCPP